MSEKDIVKFEDILNVFRKFLYMKDESFIWLTFATVIGNQMRNRRPIWLMLVAPPSSGKTTTISAIQNLELVGPTGKAIKPIHDISDLTENSFASGMHSNTTETSLLKKIPTGGIMAFKDFTSVLSKQQQAKLSIMAQLREIYDGSYVKRTGNGNDVVWSGKIGALAGVTQAVYQHLESMSVMGDRFMMYQIPQPDRKKMLRFKLDQERLNETEAEMMPIARELSQRYLQRAFDNLKDVNIKLSKKTEDDIIAVADFCTMVRSGVIVDDFTGDIKFVPEPEMPARMFDQMMALASAFLFMRQLDGQATDDNGITEEDFNLLYKISYDSIPITRRIALSYLAKYNNGVETAALASRINYPTKVTAQWLAHLNALGVVERLVGTGRGNIWRIKAEYLTLVQQLQGVVGQDEFLLATETSDNEVEKFWEQDRASTGINLDSVSEMVENDTW